ncbi:MAG: hypothetical protein PWR32_774, partial [Candidatus Woesearchaeota archaeon]|nr:hypothetical protein [Candidatus Woesearchaeota archaeon]
GGTIYGDGSGITNLPSASVQDVWVNESGDTMTGDLDMNSNDIINANLIHAKSLGIADTYTNAVNNLPAGNSLYVQDDIKVGGNIKGYGADVAEKFHIKGDLEPGDVVIITHYQGVEKASKPYDTRVAGIISTKPAYIMAIGREGLPIALAGSTPVKVTNESGPIHYGDLLTTSSTPGYAMKCPDIELCRGAIIGKALEEFNASQGIISALVMLG